VFEDFLFTSESVTEGHPDKLADRISDAILDELIRLDPLSRVAVETLVTHGTVIVAGEITTEAYVHIPEIVRSTIIEVGYTRVKYGFDGETCGVLTCIENQSEEISKAVMKGTERLGAGDQGMMFGFATDETPNMMPAPICLAHKLARRMAEKRRSGELPQLLPDGKTQVTVRYEKGRPVAVEKVLISAQHRKEVGSEELRKLLIEHVIQPTLEDAGFKLPSSERIIINPSGSFTVGGPSADTGLTGRKIVVDTYGGFARVGGGCFSGKDPTKVDRSGAYAARYVAKNLVAAGVARRVEVEISYAIGMEEPFSVDLEFFGTLNPSLSKDRVLNVVRELFDLKPYSIIENLNLRRPIYKPLSAYGHFGRDDLDLPWERTDVAPLIKDALGLR
jgi:S-adenosylmethionine synthetase